MSLDILSEDLLTIEQAAREVTRPVGKSRFTTPLLGDGHTEVYAATNSKLFGLARN